MSGEWKFPDDFTAVSDRGILNLEDGLRLSDVRWMSRQKIAEYDRPTYLSDRLVPFALTASGDRYGWWMTPDKCGYEFVVFSPHDCSEADVYAPHFVGFLYRILLEDLRDCWGSWLGDQCTTEMIVAMVNRNIELASPHLPEEWEATLRKLVSNTPFLNDDQNLAWIEWDEVERIVARDFDMAAINSPIEQYV